MRQPTRRKVIVGAVARGVFSSLATADARRAWAAEGITCLEILSRPDSFETMTNARQSVVREMFSREEFFSVVKSFAEAGALRLFTDNSLRPD